MNDDDYLIIVIIEQDLDGASVKSGHHLKQRNSCLCAASVHVGVSSHTNRWRTPATGLRLVIMFSVT